MVLDRNSIPMAEKYSTIISTMKPQECFHMQRVETRKLMVFALTQKETILKLMETAHIQRVRIPLLIIQALTRKEITPRLTAKPLTQRAQVM
jgi:hypothetical protein